MAPASAKSKWRRVGYAYLILLVLSNAYRLIAPGDGVPAPDQTVLDIAAIGGEDRSLRIAWRDSGGDGPPLVLLHGTPVAGKVFAALTPALAEDYRLVVPDLPGFGGSSRRVPDYSIAAHAAYLDALLDHLGIASAHLVGYSQGGGVALELYGLAPARVRSLTLLSAIGVQELELLGDYHLNHAIHLAQLGLFQALAWGLPHFGALDDMYLNVPYARNFSDSDQRPLREILEQIDAPLLILHGEQDGLVPSAAALEHHRIAPHSELALLDSGHMMLFDDAAEVGGHITGFVSRVESGTAVRRSGATPTRLQEAAAPFNWQDAPRMEGIALAVLFLLLVVATYVSEDLTCIAAGLLVARGTIGFLPATAACLLGIFTGDLLLYLAGKYLGRPALARAPLRWIVKEDSLRRSEAWFERRGPAAILISRFIPGTRLATYVASGVLGTSLARFLGYFLLAAVLWTPLLVALAWLVGGRAVTWFSSWSQYGALGAVVIAFSLFVAVKIIVPLFSFRGRRMLVGRWRRRLRWEFWPPWIFYAPLALYIGYLGVRYRGLTVFTAANPGMPAGGFIGESKNEILARLSGASEYLVASALIPAGDVETRTRFVREFRQRHGLDYPLVLKPNAGERGRNVVIVHEATGIRDYLVRHAVPTLVQEYAAGHEFGVFYYRLPDADSGSILAITDKRPPVVTGDGHSTLERLILSDPRAVCMADHFLAEHAEKLYEIPADGKVVPLVEVGTHCLGCVFVDGEWARTPELEAVTDRISKAFDGFYFGRYDMRTPTVEDFRHGRNFKIVELNGVTSEATSIYDPDNSLISAYRTLMRQWRLAFEIGAQNRARGTRPATVRELIGLLRDTRRERIRDDEAAVATAGDGNLETAP